MDAFLDSIQDISGSTWSRKVYASILRRFVAETPRGFAEATRADVQAFLQQPSHSRRNYGQPVGASAKNLRLTVLKSFYTYASTFARDGQSLYQQPLPTLGLRYLKPPKPYKGMTAGEVEAVMRAIPSDTTIGLRDRALYLLYFFSGRRRAEICRLRWGDIEPAVIVDDETRRAGVIYRYTSKGASNQVKTKELPAPAYQVLLRYLEQSGRLASMRADSPLFPAMTAYGHAHKDNRALSSQQVYMRFKRYARAAGLDTTRITLHSLRHASARQRYELGQTPEAIQKTLDHASIATTYDYLQRQSGMADSGAALLEARFAHLSGVPG